MSSKGADLHFRAHRLLIFVHPREFRGIQFSLFRQKLFSSVFYPLFCTTTVVVQYNFIDNEIWILVKSNLASYARDILSITILRIGNIIKEIKDDDGIYDRIRFWAKISTCDLFLWFIKKYVYWTIRLQLHLQTDFNKTIFFA